MKKSQHAKTEAEKKIDGNLLGPCGIYCGYCLAYKKKVCLGCRYQADKRHREGMKNWCPLLNCSENREIAECSDCPQFPCEKQYDLEDGMYGQVYIKYIRNEIKPL